MSLLQLSRILTTSLFERGLRSTALRIFYNFSRQYEERRFDRRHAIDTAGIVELEDLKISSDTKDLCIWYEPISTKVLSDTIEGNRYWGPHNEDARMADRVRYLTAQIAYAEI